MNTLVKNCIFLLLILGLVFLIALFLLSDQINVSNLSASLLQSKEKTFSSCIAQFAPEYKKGTLSITKKHINADTVQDAIIRYTDEAHCGSAGCIHQLCVSNDLDDYTFIEFGYAAQSIQVKQTITNQMRDLVLNNEKTSKMIWDGTKYVLDETQ